MHGDNEHNKKCFPSGCSSGANLPAVEMWKLQRVFIPNLTSVQCVVMRNVELSVNKMLT